MDRPRTFLAALLLVMGGLLLMVTPGSVGATVDPCDDFFDAVGMGTVCAGVGVVYGSPLLPGFAVPLSGGICVGVVGYYCALKILGHGGREDRQRQQCQAKGGVWSSKEGHCVS